MLAKRVSRPAEELGRPGDPAWKQAPEEVVTLKGTPLGVQPSKYMAANRKAQERPTGTVAQVVVRALHNGEQIAFQLEWSDPSREAEIVDTDVFPDGAALLFPLLADAPLMTMGSESKPVTAWHWRADQPDRARVNVATGLGTTRVVDEQSTATAAEWVDGTWRVVFVRSLAAPTAEGSVAFAAGDARKVAFAVWEGSNAERAGLKAYSPRWSTVELEA